MKKKKINFLVRKTFLRKNISTLPNITERVSMQEFYNDYKNLIHYSKTITTIKKKKTSVNEINEAMLELVWLCTYLLV